jgi:hypothetical protein
MPNGTVENHRSAESFISWWTVWPAEETSIWNRPPVTSSTTLARRRAAPWSTSRAGVHIVDIRHLIFGCAMTLGARR